MSPQELARKLDVWDKARVKARVGTKDSLQNTGSVAALTVHSPERMGRSQSRRGAEVYAKCIFAPVFAKTSIFPSIYPLNLPACRMKAPGY